MLALEIKAKQSNFADQLFKLTMDSEKSRQNCQKCVLCYSYSKWTEKHQQLLNQSVSVITSCVKHIPNDLCPTINWSKFDDSNVSSLFCKTCYDIVGKLSTVDHDLEEIQKKISILVNRLVSHVKEARTKYCGYSESIVFDLDNNVELAYENDSQPTFEKDPVTNELNVSFNRYDEAKDNDFDLVASVESRNAECENSNEELNQQEGAKMNKVSQSNNISALKPFVIPPEHVKPKSGLQKVLEGSSGYPCPICHKKFSRYTIMKKHDCSKPTVECETCGMSFSSGGVLKIHIRSHTGEKPYKCETCGKAFSIKANLREHMNLHTGERNFECDICQKTFKQDSALISHKSRVHIRVEDKVFKCDVCSKDFIDLKALKAHMIMHSSGTANPFKCDICEKAFPNSKCVISRIKRVHSQKEKPFQCDQCGKRTYSSNELKSHMATHNIDRRFQCSYCEKSFKKESYLKVHELTHTSKATFDCKTCGKSFKAALHLHMHETRYHREKQICELCGKSVGYGSMKAHLRTVHEGKKVERRPCHECKICNMTFTHKRCFVNHDEKYCHICCKLFAFKRSTLLAHQIQVHTVNASLYSDSEDAVGVANKTANSPNLSKWNTTSNFTMKGSERGNSLKKIKYNESSSEEFSENSHSNGFTDSKKKIETFDYLKVEVKTEDEFSEVEEEFSEVDDF